MLNCVHERIHTGEKTYWESHHSEGKLEVLSTYLLETSQFVFCVQHVEGNSHRKAVAYIGVLETRVNVFPIFLNMRNSNPNMQMSVNPLLHRLFLDHDIIFLF